MSQKSAELLKMRAIPAKQARAQRTMERVERAARQLLNEATWAELTMADIAKAADTSIGSIYARFPSKAALLDHLDEVYCQEIEGLNGKLPTGPTDASLDQAITEFVHSVAAYHRANAGLIRTLILETRTAGHDAFHSRSARMNEGLQMTCERFRDIAARDGHKISTVKIQWVLFLVLSTLRELTLFPQGLPRPKSSSKEGKQEIVAMAMNYLNGERCGE